MAIKANLVIDQGTDFSATIDVTDSDGNAFDLTNYTSASQMRKSYASTTAYDFVTSDNNSLGQISLQMSSNTTNQIDPGRYLYDVEITSSGGQVSRVVEGIVTVSPGITR
jgi:hypothetical protein